MLKLGNRVTIRNLPEDRFHLHHLAGRRGEVVQIGNTSWLPGEAMATCPDPSMFLVDGQMVNGERKGEMSFREFFYEDELEVG